MEVFHLHAHRNGAAIRAVRRKKVRKAESLLLFPYKHQEPLPVRLLSGFLMSESELFAVPKMSFPVQAVE
jgi:hypothetical protein